MFPSLVGKKKYIYKMNEELNTTAKTVTYVYVINDYIDNINQLEKKN